MLKHKLRTEFPIFFNYTVFCVLAVVVGLVPYLLWCPQYFYLYWSMNAVMIGLEFAVMYEVFVNALKPYSALIDLGKMLFRWAAVFLFLAALLTAFATTGSQPNRIVAAVNLLERSVRLMQCGLLLLFFLFERRLGLSWRSRSMSVALGLGVYAASALSTSYLAMRFQHWNVALGVVDGVFFLGIVTFWASSLALPEPARKNVLDSPSRLIFQRWNEALTSYSVRGDMALAASGVESFLPGVEQTVDRILARKMVQ
jgi:hypothetical protein